MSKDTAEPATNTPATKSSEEAAAVQNADDTTAKSQDTEGKKPTEHKRPDPGKMMIKVYSPYQVYFDDQATSISAINDTGPFDILAKHHRFLTLLSPCELVIAADKGEEKIKISRGIMYVKEDRVTVFLDV